METHSRREGVQWPRVRLFFLFPKETSQKRCLSWQAKTDDLLCDDRGEVAGWSLGLGAAALEEFSVASFPRFL